MKKILLLVLALICNTFSEKPYCADTINTSLSISDSLKNVWPLNNENCDLKSNNTLSIVGTGLFNDSGFFNNSSGYLSLQDTIKTPRAEPFSIVFRCKLDSADLGSTVDMITGNEGTAGYIAFLHNSSPGKIWLKDSAGAYDDMLTLTGINTSNYNTYAIVFKEADSAKLYVNGVYLTYVGWHGWLYSNLYTKIAGGYTAATKYNLRGTLSYLMYFKKALTPVQVDTLYKNPFQMISDATNYTNGSVRIGVGASSLRDAILNIGTLTGDLNFNIIGNINTQYTTISKTADLGGYTLLIRDSIKFVGYENKNHKISFNTTDSIGLFDFTFNNGNVILEGLNVQDKSTSMNSFNHVELKGSASYTVRNCYFTGAKPTGNDTAINFKNTTHDSIFNVIVDSCGTAIKAGTGSRVHASNNFVLWNSTGFNLGDTAYLYNNAAYSNLNNRSFYSLTKASGYRNACDDSSCGNDQPWAFKDTNYQKENFRDGFGLFTRNNYYYVMPNNCPDRCYFAMGGGKKSDIGQNTYDLVGNVRGWGEDSFSVGVKEFVSRPQTRTKIRIGAGTGVTRFEYGIDSLFFQSSNCTLMIVGALDTVQEARATNNKLNGHTLVIMDSIRWAHPIYSNDRAFVNVCSNDGLVIVDGLHIINVYTKSDVFGILEAAWDTVIIRNCHIESTPPGKSYNISGLLSELSYGAPAYFYNNIIHDVGVGIDPVNRIWTGSVCENNIVYNCNYGTRGLTYGNMMFRNNIFFNNGIDVYNVSGDLVGYNNACSDTTCLDANWSPGSGNIININAYDEFVDTNLNSANFAYLKSNSQLKYAGCSTSIYNNKDWSGYNRPYGGRYSIGIKEMVSTCLDSMRTNNMKDSGKWRDTMNIYGSNFGSSQGSSTINIKDSTPTVISWSDTLIKVIIPNLAVGWIDTTILSDGITSDTLINGFKIFATTDTTFSNKYNWSLQRKPIITDSVVIDSFSVAPDTMHNYWISPNNISLDSNLIAYSLKLNRSFARSFNSNEKSIKTSGSQTYNHAGSLTLSGPDTMTGPGTIQISNTGFKNCSTATLVLKGNTTIKTAGVKFSKIIMTGGKSYSFHARDTVSFKNEVSANLSGTSATSRVVVKSDTTGRKHYLRLNTKLSPTYHETKDTYVLGDTLNCRDTTTRNLGGNGGLYKKHGTITIK
jgi:hypothetical protein